MRVVAPVLLGLGLCACANATLKDPDARVRIDGLRVDARKVEADSNPEAPDARRPPDASPPIDGAPPLPDRCEQASPVVAGATATGNTTGYANDVEITGCTSFFPDGPDAIYTITVAAGQTINARVQPVEWDASIYIAATCSFAPACLAGSDLSAGFDAETASVTVGAAGTYFIIVDGWDPSAYGPYSLTVNLQ